LALTVLSVAYPHAPVGRDAVGGAEQVLATLDAALATAGHRSIVIACEGSAIAGELVPLGVPSGPIGGRARARAWEACRALIRRVLDGEPVDVVHLHGVDLAEYLPDPGVPTLATLHLPLAWYPPRLFAQRPDLWLHGVSEAQHATRPPGAELLPPIPNGVPPRLFETRGRKRGHAIQLARICPEKGVHLALDAARAAGATLLIGGQVFPYAAHRRYFRDEVAPRLDRRRRFLGPLGFDRKRRLLASAGCALVPSLVPETSSLSAIEALACGTPVVALRVGALPEVVTDGITGFLVDDARGLADAIAAAPALDPEACRASAARFSAGRMADRYLALYAALRDRGGEVRGPVHAAITPGD
jgi:glycosyltransferase involved in cell wall biosynthesis